MTTETIRGLIGIILILIIFVCGGGKYDGTIIEDDDVKT